MAPPVEFEGIVLNRPQERQLMARREHSVSASTNRSVNNSPNAILARSDPRRLNASTPQRLSYRDLTVFRRVTNSAVRSRREAFRTESGDGNSIAARFTASTNRTS